MMKIEVPDALAADIQRQIQDHRDSKRPKGFRETITNDGRWGSNQGMCGLRVESDDGMLVRIFPHDSVMGDGECGYPIDQAVVLMDHAAKFLSEKMGERDG